MAALTLGAAAVRVRARLLVRARARVALCVFVFVFVRFACARGCGCGQVDEDLADLAAVEAVCRAELARAAALPASRRDAFIRALPRLQWPPE